MARRGWKGLGETRESGISSISSRPPVATGISVCRPLPSAFFCMGQDFLGQAQVRSEEHTSELQSQSNLVCRLLLEKKKKQEDATFTENARRPSVLDN